MEKKIILSLIVVSFLLTSFAKAATFDSNNQKAISENVTYLRKQLKSASEDQVLKIAKYLAYIQLTPKMANYKKDVTRLLESSMQFILCDQIEDTACLEATPLIKPSKALRVDALAGLGKPTYAGKKLDLDYYFTNAWFDNYSKKTKKFVNPSISTADRLAEKIRQSEAKSIYFAMYGIDDLAGSMAPVYNSVKDVYERGVSIKAVVDVSDGTKPNDFIRDYDLVQNADGTYRIVNMPGKLDISYVMSKNEDQWAFGAPSWMVSFLKDAEKATAKMKATEARDYLTNKFIKVDKSFKGNADATLKDTVWLALNKKSSDATQTVTRMTYQYDGTMEFMRLLNGNVNKESDIMARIETPYSGIMHNKFVVFEASQQKAVWTGTANISQTCMGTENNANVSIFIRNDEIAQAFKDEFTEMFKGDFHAKKRPNTRRYFTFDDGTEVRVHFSPTDDGEHRVLLPLIYSAQKGDILRISMFGSGGYELVRALQAAEARGVNIKIAIDNLTGTVLGSWIKSNDANLLEKNPYSASPSGSIQLRKSAWPGLNHHKSATLTRKNGQAEVIVVGSQNWSAAGNDTNDENMVTISNKSKSLEIMEAYNKEFDEKIWSASVELKK